MTDGVIFRQTKCLLGKMLYFSCSDEGKTARTLTVLHLTCWKCNIVTCNICIHFAEWIYIPWGASKAPCSAVNKPLMFNTQSDNPCWLSQSSRIVCSFEKKVHIVQTMALNWLKHHYVLERVCMWIPLKQRLPASYNTVQTRPQLTECFNVVFSDWLYFTVILLVPFASHFL